LDHLYYRDDRIHRLEQELRRSSVFLSKLHYDFVALCRYSNVRLQTTDLTYAAYVQPSTPVQAPLPASATTDGSKGTKASVSNGVRSGLTSPTGHPAPWQQASSHPYAGRTSPGPASLGQSSAALARDATITDLHQASLADERRPLHEVDEGVSSDTIRLASSNNIEETVRTPPRSRDQLRSPTTLEATANGNDAAMDHHRATSPGLSSGRSNPGSAPSSATFPPWIRSDRGVTAAAATSSSPGISSRGREGQDESNQPSTPPAPPSKSNQHQRSLTTVAETKVARPRTNTSANTTSTSQTASTSSAMGLTSSKVVEDSAKSSGSPTAQKDSFAGTASTVGSSENPYKSFRVTLEDPCYKVLPAALKKYKINDDWRLYALFICYGTTERCLSYDEKPLLLFQKLKEARQNPVFMLRHIRDVKSPIMIAEAKKAARRGSSKDSSSSSLSTKRLGEAQLASASLASSSSTLTASGSDRSNATVTGPAAQIAQSDTAKTYAIAIYPYTCERDEEFDVTVGDTFIVLSKAKGWWIVQRDSIANGSGDVLANQEDADTKMIVASGWVPAGCLIETSKPLASVVDGINGSGVDQDDATPTPSGSGSLQSKQIGSKSSIASLDKASAPIPPSIITSTSTPGIMLMDYSSLAAPASSKNGTPNTGSEGAGVTPSTTTTNSSSSTDSSTSSQPLLELKKDDRLRVFKRYNHWSYCVQEGGAWKRGWVPSWYIGKVSSSSTANKDSAAAVVGTSQSGSRAIAGEKMGL